MGLSGIRRDACTCLDLDVDYLDECVKTGLFSGEVKSMLDLLFTSASVE